MNKEREQLKEDRNRLVEQSKDNKREKLALREMVEKLDTKVSKEASENKNLTATVI